MIAYIDMSKDHFGVESICRVLGATDRGFITSSGYRATKSRSVIPRALRDVVPMPVLNDLHKANYRVYGVAKMWHAMACAGWTIGRHQIAR